MKEHKQDKNLPITEVSSETVPTAETIDIDDVINWLEKLNNTITADELHKKMALFSSYEDKLNILSTYLKVVSSNINENTHQIFQNNLFDDQLFQDIFKKNIGKYWFKDFAKIILEKNFSAINEDELFFILRSHEANRGHIYRRTILENFYQRKDNYIQENETRKLVFKRFPILNETLTKAVLAQVLSLSSENILPTTLQDSIDHYKIAEIAKFYGVNKNILQSIPNSEKLSALTRAII